MKLRAFLVACQLTSPAAAAEIKLARHPDYREGQIVFSYLGDLWVVKEDGSQPRRLTVHPARDIHPHFSPDGKWIAFSSNRYGNYDVFLIPATGGTVKRLTYHGASDTVVGWTRDSQRVIFNSARGRVYPGIPSLYEVPIDGSLEQPVAADWGWWGAYSQDGKRFAFNRHPMVWSRKHYRGSYAADLWLLNAEDKSFKKLLDAELPDEQKPNNFWPMFGRDAIYFVSDRNVTAKAGSPEVYKSINNIWKVPPDGGTPVQVTQHTSGSLFWPSISSDGRVIVYEENFGLWKLDLESGKTSEVKIDIVSDDKENNHETLTVQNEADSFHVSPSGKRAVITTHGELFTIATDKGDVRRLSQTPSAREGLPQWSPDGQWIAFVSDQSGRDEVWLCDEHGGKQKKISDSDTQKSQLAWSPDSKFLLYAASDKKLYKYAVASGETSSVAHGEVIGFGGSAVSGPQWSPDGKWIAYSKMDTSLLPHVYIVPADGGPEKRVTDADTYSDSSPHWSPDGKYLVYLTGIDVGNIGQAGRSTAQLVAVALSSEEKNPRDTGVDSEEEAKAERANRRPQAPAEAADRAKTEVKIQFEGLPRRTHQLTRSGDSISALAVGRGNVVAFSTSGTEGGRPVQSLWTINISGERLTRVTQSSAGAGEEDGPPARRGFGGGGFSSLQFSTDARTLFYRQGSNIYSVAIPGTPAGGESAATTPSGPPTGGRGGSAGARPGTAPAAAGGATPRRIDFTAKVEVDHRAERKQVFDESWRVMKHRFYDAEMHGVDWNRLKTAYEPLLAYAGDQEEMHDIVMEMIGELNASHTGISGGGRGERGATQTRYPGFELEPADGYYKVTHVYKKGPADHDYVKIKAGDFIIAIDGQPLKAGDNYWRHFAYAPGTKMEFTVNSKPSPEGAWTTKVTPVSTVQQSNLEYEKWVADRRAMTDKLSGGTVGYLHIRQMNEPSLRQFERDLAMLHNKKALVIDQRFNPGGGIDQELLQILQQRQYQYTRVRDSIHVTRPLRGFFGPMVVMENERSTSDAEVFPDGFRTLKLGKVVGVTTYGAVIGTGAYQLMDGSTLRTPSSGLWNVKGTNLENYGVPPDVYIDNTPADFLKGRDAQLEKAVEVLKSQLQTTQASR